MNISLSGRYFVDVFIIATRLVDGDFPWEGRVEVLHDGEWGTVCDDSWSVEDARVVCRSLGYAGAASALPWATFGPGSGGLVLDDVKCVGNEESIFDCPHGGMGKSDCTHNEDAGVRCQGINFISFYL